jgi:hypothetical protein
MVLGAHGVINYADPTAAAAKPQSGPVRNVRHGGVRCTELNSDDETSDFSDTA